MSSNYYFFKNKNRLASFLLASFIIISFIEIIAEYCEDKFLIWGTKPFIIPFLLAYYLSLTKKSNYYFLVAMFFSWVANLLFIENTLTWIIYGSTFFLIYRMIIIYIVMNKIKMPSLVPLILGSIPFIFIYAMICFLSFEAMGDNIYLFLTHGIFNIFLGGLSLGNYIMVLSKSNLFLFLSTMLFALTQFSFVIKVYYEDTNVFQAMAMLMFVIGQFLLTKFIFLTEESNSKHETMDKSNLYN